MKAFLIEHNVDFPRNHDLVRLLVLCLTVDESFETIRDNLCRLENYAVIIRYPGLIVPLELAQEAFENASRVRGFVKKKLKVR